MFATANSTKQEHYEDQSGTQRRKENVWVEKETRGLIEPVQDKGGFCSGAKQSTQGKQLLLHIQPKDCRWRIGLRRKRNVWVEKETRGDLEPAEEEEDNGFYSGARLSAGGAHKQAKSGARWSFPALSAGADEE